MDIGAEETTGLMRFLKSYGIRYIFFFNNEYEDVTGYSSMHVLNYQIIRRNLNALFKVVYEGHGYDVYSAIP